VVSDVFGLAIPAGPWRSRQLQPVTGAELGLGDLDELTFEEFCARFLERRDALALRRLQGERLDARDESALAIMNAWLDEHLPRAAPLPASAREAVAEILRRKRQP
jgi:hypothetical protein